MPANLYQRSGVWWARVQINGRDTRRSLRTTDRREAARRLRAIIDQAEDTRAGIARQASGTWAEAVDRWMAMPAYQKLRPSTRERYDDSLVILADHWGPSLALAAIGKPTISQFIAARTAAGRQPSTIKRDLDVIAMVVKESIKAGYLPDDFHNAAAARREDLPERNEPFEPVDLRLFATMLRRAPPGLAALFRFLARTGCRADEGMGLLWREVDLTRGTCLFARTKTRRVRTITLKPQALRDLRRQREQATSEFVFPSRLETRYGSVAGRWRELVTSAVKASGHGDAGRGGVSFGFAASPRCHDLRHTYAVRWLQQGGSIYDLSRHLGHSSIGTTERFYTAWLTRRADR